MSFITMIFKFVGTYYIDIFSTTFIIAIINIAFREKDILSEKFKLYVLALIIGICTGIKVSNLILIFPICVYILMKNRKNIKTINAADVSNDLRNAGVNKKNIAAVGAMHLDLLRNNIFKSKWFDTISWKDSRFGIPNKFYSLIWPLMIYIEPSKTFDFDFVDNIWGIGYLFVIFYLILGGTIFKEFKKDKKTFEFGILILVLSIFWALFLLGYVRYATILPILFSFA